MKRTLVGGLLIVALAGCTPAENEGGTPIPQSEAPLNDEAVGPSEEQDPVEDAAP